MDNRKEKQNVMIKPVHNCNMSCSYCFVKNLAKKYKEQKISFNILNEAFRVLSNTAREVDIIWHGGEPTLMGVDWYKDMIELTSLYTHKTKFSHSMQTNGLTLDEKWGDLAKNWGIDIAVSFDGLYQYLRGDNTKSKIEDNLIKFKNVTGNVGCLSIVTEDSYKGMIDNYKYFRELDIPVSFNYGINNNLEEQENYIGITIDDWIKEYSKYFKYWLNDRGGFNERSCINLIEQVLGLNERTCSYSDCRYNWVNINPDGSTAHCNRFFPEEYGMGNIENVDVIEELYKTKGYKLFCSLIQKRIDNECINCSHLPYCNGGCQSLHLMNTGNLDKADKLYCERFKKEFEMVYKTIKNVDIYNNNKINQSFLSILNKGIYMPKEINDFMRSIGIIQFGEDSNEETLLDTKEFKIFRIFNPKKLKFQTDSHIDFMSVHSDIFGTKKHREIRLNEIRKIFKRNKNKIFEIIKEETMNDKGRRIKVI